MKLLGFTTWQHCSIPIPSSSSSSSSGVTGCSENDYSNIIHQIIPPSKNFEYNSSSSHRRRKRPKTTTTTTTNNKTIDIHPNFTLTTSNQLSILGHDPSSTKTTTDQDSSPTSQQQQRPLHQIPEWSYETRPDPLTSLLSQNKGSDLTKNAGRTNSRRIGAVVDAESRMVFCLQRNNCRLTLWNLDGGGGLEDAGVENGGGVQTVRFESPVVCMEALPHCNKTSHKAQDDLAGGVIGSLASGQIFLVIKLTSTDRVKVGIFEPPPKKNIGKKNKRKKAAAAKYSTNRHILSVAGAHPASMAIRANDTGATGLDEPWGTVSLTTLTVDKLDHGCSGNTVMICRHRIVLPSSLFQTKSIAAAVTAMGTETDTNTITSTTLPDSTYSLESGYIELPHAVHTMKKGASAAEYYATVVQATQLDRQNTAIVYYSSNGSWYCVTLNTTTGKFATKPFSIQLPPTTSSPPLHKAGNTQLATRASSPPTSIVEIGGLNYNILTVLSSNSILTTLDISRATVVHEVDVRTIFRQFDGGALGTVRMAVHHSGIVGIINYTSKDMLGVAGGGANGPRRRDVASVCTAKIGIVESEDGSSVQDVAHQHQISKCLLKGEYNLNRAIASSMASTLAVPCADLARPVVASSVQQNMEAWFPIRKVASVDKDVKKMEKWIDQGIAELEFFRYGKEQLNSGSFSQCFINSEDNMTNRLPQQPLQLKSKKSRRQTLITPPPQRFTDAALSIAIDIILNPRVTRTRKLSASDVLMRCIRSGNASGHGHLERATSRCIKDGNNTFHSILFSLDHDEDKDEDATTSSDTGKLTRPTTAKAHADSPPPQSLLLIDTVLEYCNDSIPENMLVTMLHYVLCHVTREQLALHCKGMKHIPHEVRRLEERLAVAKGWIMNGNSKITKGGGDEYMDVDGDMNGDDVVPKNGMKLSKKHEIKDMLRNADELMRRKSINGESGGESIETNGKRKDDRHTKVNSLLTYLEARLFTHHQMYFVRAIVTSSRCNEALLRTALKHGMTQAGNGEIEVLMKMLTKLLHDKTNTQVTLANNSPTINHTVCIVQWLSALTDSHMGILFTESLSSTSNFANAMGSVRERVSSAIAQGHALLNLKDLLNHVDVVYEKEKERKTQPTLNRKRKRARISMSSSDLPVYSIETLMF